MIYDKVVELLAEQLDKDVSAIKPTSRIVEDLGADSIDLAVLLMKVEEEFGFSVPEDKLGELKTVNDIVKFIDKNNK